MILNGSKGRFWLCQNHLFMIWGTVWDMFWDKLDVVWDGFEMVSENRSALSEKHMIHRKIIDHLSCNGLIKLSVVRFFT